VVKYLYIVLLLSGAEIEASRTKEEVMEICKAIVGVEEVGLLVEFSYGVGGSRIADTSSELDDCSNCLTF
jgi:hypothetical protein